MTAENTRSCADEFRDAVTRYPSILGCLIAVAALYDREKDQYRHGLAARFGAEAVDRALRELHMQIFLRWLSLTLRQQLADLSLHLRAAALSKESLAGL